MNSTPAPNRIDCVSGPQVRREISRADEPQPHRREQHEDRHLDGDDDGLPAAHELGAEGVDHRQQRRPHRPPAISAAAREGVCGDEGRGVAAEGRGIERERDDVAGPHEQVEPAGEYAVAESSSPGNARRRRRRERWRRAWHRNRWTAAPPRRRWRMRATWRCRPPARPRRGSRKFRRRPCRRCRSKRRRPCRSGPSRIGIGRTGRPGGAHRHGSTCCSISRTA